MKAVKVGNYLQRAWIILVCMYTAMFLLAYTLGVVATPINGAPLKNLCTASSSSAIYSVVTYVLPVVGQAFFSDTAAIEGICVSYMYGNLGLTYIAIEYFYMTMLALLIAIPAADSTILMSLLALYFSHRRSQDEVFRDKLRALVRGGAITYSQHALLTVVVLLLLVLSLKFL